MISACMVTAKERSEKFLEIFFESLQENTTLIEEIIIIDIGEVPSFYKEYKLNEITVKKFGPKHDLSNFNKLQRNALPTLSSQHALALHCAIKETKNDYLLLTHSDVFLYSDVPSIFVDLMDHYNLNIIGCSVPGVDHCQGCFPNVIFTLVKKSSLPNEDFLKGKIKLNGIDFEGSYFLNCDRLEPELMSLFPYPDGMIDTGVLLYLCSLQLKWRWLAIQTGDLHNYNTKYYKSNVKEIKLKPKKLIYHHGGATYFYPGSKIEFIKTYEHERKLKNNE